MRSAPLVEVCRCVGCFCYCWFVWFFFLLLSHISLKPGGLVIPRGLTASPAACPPADQKARLFVRRELPTVD